MTAFNRHVRWALLPLLTLLAMLIFPIPQATAAGSFPNVAVGIPAHVDPASVDKADHKPFSHTIGLGLEQTFGEPGKLLVGPEVPQSEIDRGNGAIERFNPTNQIVLSADAPTGVNVPEGGFTLFSLGVGAFQVGDYYFELWGEPGNNYLLAIRGHYADGKQDSDLNSTAMVTSFVPGHAIAMIYPGQPNGGFISEGQLLQMVKTAHTGGTNCGAEGCSSVTVVTLDLNTGAFSAAKQVGVDGPWSPITSNWR